MEVGSVEAQERRPTCRRRAGYNWVPTAAAGKPAVLTAGFFAPSRPRQPPPPSPSRAKMSKDNRGSSAHATGGAAKVKSAFLWRLDTVSLGKHQRNGVEWQQRATKTSQGNGAHVESTMTRPPCLARLRVRRFIGQKLPPPTASSTPFLCSCAKKRGGAPKKRAFGCRHGTCSVPPASPTNSKPQHHHRLRQADLSARSTAKPLPKSGEDE